MTEAPSLDGYRCAVAALDQLDRFVCDPSLGPERPRLQHIIAEIRSRVDDLRDKVEDLLLADHGRLGFESESKREPAADEESAAPTARRGKLSMEDHEAIRRSRASVKALAEQYGVSRSRIYEIRCGARRERSSRKIMQR